MKRSMSAVCGAAADEDEICGIASDVPIMHTWKAYAHGAF